MALPKEQPSRVEPDAPKSPEPHQEVAPQQEAQTVEERSGQHEQRSRLDMPHTAPLTPRERWLVEERPPHWG